MRVESSGFADGLDVGYKRKKGAKNDVEVLSRSDCSDCIRDGEDWGRGRQG